jgi:hypothetical protein
MAWECTCGRDNQDGARSCILCGSVRESRADEPGGVHGAARYAAGIRWLERNYEYQLPRGIVGGQARLDGLSDAEIDALLSEVESMLREALDDEEERMRCEAA